MKVNPPPGYKPIGCHLIFEVKPDLCRKARYVAEGYRSKPPTAMTYASVVGRDSVRIGFLLATLNDLDVLAGDIQNAFLNAPCAEKVYFIGGPEWGALQGRVIVIVRALYGLKSAGASWRHHFADFLRGPEMEFFESKADENVWMKAATFPDGRKYYTYIFVYVDDILIMDKNSQQYMVKLKDDFIVRPETVKTPDVYLGTDIIKDCNTVHSTARNPDNNILTVSSEEGLVRVG